MAQQAIHITPFGTSGPTQYVGTAAPTSGTYAQGDICWNSAPSAGGASFWTCTTAGSPGTWKAVNCAA